MCNVVINIDVLCFYIMAVVISHLFGECVHYIYGPGICGIALVKSMDLFLVLLYTTPGTGGHDQAEEVGSACKNM